MDVRLKFAIFVTLVGFCSGQVISRGRCPNVKLQPDFDLNQYIGKWYELQRFFAIFQATSVCVTANYTLQPDNTVKVNNTGWTPFLRRYTTAIGEAKQVDPSNPAKLGVRFFDLQPYGDYWVLSTDYRTYTIVWSCSENSLGFFGYVNTQFAWILTREPNGITEAKRTELENLIASYGIDISKFSRTRQTDCPGR